MNIPELQSDSLGELVSEWQSAARHQDWMRAAHDLDEMIDRIAGILELTPEDHPNQPLLLSELGARYQLRFEELGYMEDLGKAIELGEEAVRYTPDGHSEKPARLSNLGASYMRQFESQGRLDYLNRSIACIEQAVHLTSDDDAYKPGHLNNLGNSYAALYGVTGRLGDLQTSISSLERSVDLTPDGHPDRPSRLGNLGSSYWSLYQRLGEPGDLDKSIGYMEQAADLAPNGHPDKRIFLHNLSSSYSDLYGRLGKLSDLEKSISCVGQAVDLTPDCHPDKSVRLNHLGDSYLVLYRRLGRLGDLDRSIIYREQVVGLTPDNHPDKDSRLNSLAVSYSDRYKRLGKLDDLDKSIRRAEQVIDLTPNGHPSRPAVLSNLGRLYLDLYQRLGDLEDLNKSISYNEQAVDLAPDSHPNKPGCLNNLGNSYLDLYLRLGRLGDLDKSINSQEQAVDLARDDHSDKPICLSSLGTSYAHLHKRLGRPSDLDRSMSCLVQAVNLTPDDHSAKYEYLNNLSGLLRDSYRQRGVLGDIEQSITALEQAISLMPNDHPNRFMPLHGLGNGYAMIFGHLGRIEDSSKAIDYYSLALSLLPSASPYESGCLSELGAVYGVRFEAFGNMEDADRALAHLAKAERLCPDHDPGRTVRLIRLGALHLDLFVRTEQRNHGLSAMTFYRSAAHVVRARASLRLNSSRKWATLATLFSSAPLEAYQYCMTLLPQVVWLGTSVTDQHVAISRDVQDLVASAASMAILSQRYDLALEWLEQGRSIVWGQLLQLRTPLNELSDRCPKLAEELRQVSSGLERTSTSSLFEQPLVAAGGLFRDTSGEHRRLAQRWEELLKSVWALPGLEGFLLPPKSQEIASLVTEGVAAIINIKENQGCDVLIIQSKAPTISHVLLPSFSSKKAEQLHNELKSCLAAQGTRRGVRKIERKPDFSRILSLLWHEVVKPVIDHLGIMYNPLLEDLPHITWCTTGPLSFLPLHAAGDYSHPSTALPYLAVSSYTPTIGALARSYDPSSDTFSGLLAVGHESSVRGLSPLPGTKAELDRVASYAADIKMTRLDEENACADAVLQALSDHSWVHFACHGSQNPSEPMKSALHLHDQDLTLSTITRTRLKNAQLAFLSACQTAAGDSDLPDESIHLAAGLLMAGYRTVIATMWSIDDRDAPFVAGKVYECLLENNVPDSRKAAKALHKAVASLRESIGVDQFARWVPYIHIGR